MVFEVVYILQKKKKEFFYRHRSISNNEGYGIILTNICNSIEKSVIYIWYRYLVEKLISF